jgi:hypothetical protein
VDVIDDGVTGALDTDLGRASLRALSIDPKACRERALRASWESCAHEFEHNLAACQTHSAPRSRRATAVTGNILN